jgi:hypothetical protein
LVGNLLETELIAATADPQKSRILKLLRGQLIDLSLSAYPALCSQGFDG